MNSTAQKPRDVQENGVVARSVFFRAQYQRPRTLAPPLNCEYLNKMAYESQCADSFWRVYLPYACTVSPLAARYSTTGWTALVQRLYPDHEILKLSLGAISFCAVGYQYSAEWMMVKGRRLYGLALRKMAHTLRSPRTTDDNLCIITSRLLSLFEVIVQVAGSLMNLTADHCRWQQTFFETNQNNKIAQYKLWFDHSSGEAALLLRRKPEVYATHDAHSLFEDGRLHMVCPRVH